MLVSRGAQVDSQDSEGRTPIDYAMELVEGKEEMLAVLRGKVELFGREKRLDFCSIQVKELRLKLVKVLQTQQRRKMDQKKNQEDQSKRGQDKEANSAICCNNKPQKINPQHAQYSNHIHSMRTKSNWH